MAAHTCARRTRTPTIESIDAAEALAMPGVLAVFTAADLAALQPDATQPARTCRRR